MKRTIFFLLSLSTIFMTMLADNEQEAAINLQHKRPDGFKVEKGATFAVYPSSY